MAGHAFKFRKQTRELIAELTHALRYEHETHLEAWGDYSERWQAGERGQTVVGWIAEVEDLAATLYAFEKEPSE